MLERWLRHPLLPYLGIALLLASAALTKVLLGTQTAILVLAGGALLAIILLMWSSLQSLTGVAPLTLEEALSIGAPRAEEEQKRAVLRALKDLEYERSVGKISDEDYAELSNRYRAEAKRLIRSIDEQSAPMRQRVEDLVARHLASAGMASEETDSEAPIADEPTGPKSERNAPAGKVSRAPTRRCGACDTRNELDALFCKRCAKRLAESNERLCPACPAVYPDTLSQCPECGVAREAE